MKFTWWTYFVAIRRAHRQEVQCWQDHVRAVRGPEGWQNALHHTVQIQERAHRHGIKWAYLWWGTLNDYQK